jgi:hypothetical protein
VWEAIRGELEAELILAPDWAEKVGQTTTHYQGVRDDRRPTRTPASPLPRRVAASVMPRMRPREGRSNRRSTARAGPDEEGDAEPPRGRRLAHDDLTVGGER